MNDSTAVPKNTKSFFAVPSQSVRRAYLQAVVLFCLLFAAVYGGADYLAGLRNNRLRVDFAFEQNLPFVAELSPVYSSLYFMFLTVPFVVRRKEQVWSYARTMAAITVVAGICFLLLPAELAFRLPTRDRDLPLFFRLADWLNLTYNLCPSLHVAYAVYHAEFLRKQICRCGWMLHAWALAIAVAAWLTYQHHLVDLIGGWVLGFGSALVCASVSEPVAASTATQT